MLRFLTFATLILVAVCLVLGASIALAGDEAPSRGERIIEAVDPDRRMIDGSIAAAEGGYEIDFAGSADHGPHPEFDKPSGSAIAG